MKSAGALMQENKEVFDQKRRETFFCKFINDGTIPSNVFLHGEVAYHDLGRINDPSTTSQPVTKKPSGTMSMSSVNSVSLMPSTSLVGQIFSIMIRIVSGLIYAIPTIIRMKSGRESLHC